MVDRLDFILKKSQIALLEHTNSDDISSLTVALIFIVILVLIAISAVTIKHGSHPRYMVFIAAAIFLFLLYRLRMLKAANTTKLYSNYTSVDPNARKEYASALCQYLISGFEMKTVRARIVILFYAVLTPILPVSTYDFFYGFMTDKQFMLSLLVTLPLSYFIWKWWFSEDMNKFTYLKEDYDKYLKEISSTI